MTINLVRKSVEVGDDGTATVKKQETSELCEARATMWLPWTARKRSFAFSVVVSGGVKVKVW